MDIVILVALVILAIIQFVILMGIGSVYQRLTIVDNKQDEIIQKECEIMATVQDFSEAVARIKASVDAGNTSLANIQGDIQALKDKIATGGLTGEQEDAVRQQIADLEATVSAQADRLAAIDAENPATPPDEPPVEPVP